MGDFFNSIGQTRQISKWQMFSDLPLKADADLRVDGCTPMANDPPFATLNHFTGDLGIPSESDSLRIGIKDTTPVTRCRGVAMTAVGQTRPLGAFQKRFRLAVISGSQSRGKRCRSRAKNRLLSRDEEPIASAQPLNRLSRSLP